MGLEMSAVDHQQPFTATLEADIEEAMRARAMSPEWTAKSLALHTQAVLQGAFILAKAKGGPEIAVESVDHLIRYLKLLFGPEKIENPK
jgi:TetR/AcrR family transcriptional regulator, transcriptional repressor for nem operon